MPLRRLAPQRVQPWTPLQIDPGHPAAAGLIGLWIAGNRRNLVGSSALLVPSEIVSSQGGMAARFAGQIETSTAHNATSWGFATAFVTGTSSGQSAVIGRGAGNADFGFHGLHGNASYSGAVYSGSSFSIIGKPTGGALAQNTRYVIGAGAAGGAGAVYLDGRRTASVASGLSTPATTGITALGQDQGGASTWTNPPAYEYVYLWNRWPSDAIFEQVAESPYDILQGRRIWVPVSAGGGAQTVAIGQASEADTAQAVAAIVDSATAIGQASEANTAQPIAARQLRAIGQASESNTAQAFAAAQRKAIGQATETDAAQALAASQRKAIGQSIEVDTAQPVSYSAPGVVGQATETDAAQPFAARQARAIGQALESNASQPITASTGTAVAIGLALEIDTAGAFAALGPIAIAIGQAQEVDLARAMTSSGGDASIDPATIRRVARSPALPRLARAPAPWRSTNGL